MPRMPFSLIGASLLKTSRNRKFLKRRSGPALRFDLNGTLIGFEVVTAIRHTKAIVSAGAIAGNIRRRVESHGPEYTRRGGWKQKSSAKRCRFADDR